MKRASIINRLLAGVFFVCLLIVLGQSFFQISKLQQHDMEVARQELDHFEATALNSVREAVWNYDWKMIETIVESQVGPVLTYVEICGLAGDGCVSSGNDDQGPALLYEEPLLYRVSPEQPLAEIGRVRLKAAYQPFDQLIKQQSVAILLTNALGVLGVAISIFLLFHFVAIRRLVRVEDYTRSIDLTAVENLQPLDFNDGQRSRDEVDLLAEDINNLIIRIKEEFDRRQQLEQELGHIQKMEALGTLAGGIAHDFNNILAAMLGYVQLCLNSAEPGSKLAERLEHVLAAGQRAKGLIGQILVFSRKGEESRENVRVSEVVREALGLVEASLPQHVAIDTDLDDSLWIHGDGGQLHQVIMNLTLNAAHAMAESGGTLTISSTREELQNQTAETLGLKAGDYVRLKFADQGTGIPKEVRERIFDPFFTTKKTGEGTGMGLAVVHGITQAHGGRIMLDYTSREGTCFSLYLPLGENEDLQDQPAERSLATGSEHLLLVDDEPIVIKMATDILEFLGYRVTACNRPCEVEELLLADDSFALVMTDLTMPELNGVELAYTIKQLRPELPVVILSGYADFVDNTPFEDGTLAGLIHKPFTLDDLATTVDKLLHPA
ncbi:MAG: hypothetical protein C0622_08750 [Desulfuromonas sp.]|nr:MAG: hypothetical protein C0622_08750 [Desulfuromonas sp.]